MKAPSPSSVKGTTPPSYARCAFEHALTIIGDAGAPATDRSQAVLVAHTLGAFVPFDERLASDTMNVIARRLAEADVVYFLLKTLRDNLVDPSPLAMPVARLAARAHRRGPRASLLPIVVLAVEQPEWCDELRDTWVHEALSWALNLGLLPMAAKVVTRWIAEFERVPGWLRGALAQRPELLRQCGPSVAWEVHQAAPTTEGWKLLAHIDKEHVVRPEAFGMSLQAAVRTLAHAIAEMPEEAARVVLAMWCARLGGGE